MENRFRVVRTEGQHISGIAPLFDKYRMFYGQASDPAGAESFLRDRMAAGESVVYHAIHQESGAIAGFMQLYPSFSSVSMRRIWILNDLFVASPFRRQGAAHLLLAQAEELAAATGAKGIELSTAVTNVQAQKIYRNAGYEQDEEFLHFFRTIQNGY